MGQWEGGLGGPDIHAMAWLRTDSGDGCEEATRIVRNEMRRAAGSRSGSFRTRRRSRTKTGSGPRASISVSLIPSRSRRSMARTRLRIRAMACWRRMARGVL